MKRIAVIGAGSWGTTAASLAAQKTSTVLWARRAELAETINNTRENPDYLPGHVLPDGLVATSDLGRALDGSDLVVMAVPSHGFRAVFKEAAPSIGADTPVISLSKGIEQETLATMTEVVAQEAPEHDGNRSGVPHRAQPRHRDCGSSACRGGGGNEKPRVGPRDPRGVHGSHIPRLHPTPMWWVVSWAAPSRT